MASLSIFGDAPQTLQAFEDRPAGGDDFRLVEHRGKGVIFTVVGPEQVSTASYGVKTAIRCSSVVVLGGETFSDVLIFNAAPVDQLKGSAGQTVVAEVEVYSPPKNPNVEAPRLKAPSPETLRAAEALAAS